MERISAFSSHMSQMARESEEAKRRAFEAYQQSLMESAKRIQSADKEVG